MRTFITVPKLAAVSLVVIFGIVLSLPTYAGTPNYGTLRKSTMTGKSLMESGKSQKGFTTLTRAVKRNTLWLVKRTGMTTPLRRRFDWIITIGRVLFFGQKARWSNYVYYLNVPNNKTELWRHKDGAWNARDNIAQIPAVEKVQIKNGEWIDMKVVVEGSEFQIYLNGKLQGEHDDDAYKTGQVGVWAWETEASFDDFTVSGDNIEDTLAVDPRRKLATTWARLKRVY